MAVKMKSIAIIGAIVFFWAAPSFGQVVTPVLSPPPCAGHNCLSRPRGATVPPSAASKFHKADCPQGTVYDPRKGTCKVMPTFLSAP
jgi:hypothetical protein